MKVVCAGVNKTGTKSIAKALRHLGFNVFDWEEQILDFIDHWLDVFNNGAKPHVKRVYQNADAVVDIPGNLFWEEIQEAFPDCKVILSERDEDSWVKSLVNQLEAKDAVQSRTMSILSPTMRKMNFIGDSNLVALVGSRNKASTYAFRNRYRIHNHRVKSLVPPDKLLVYNVQQGWKPLCDFLGCEVPTTAFPHENVKGGEIKKLASSPLSMTESWFGNNFFCRNHCSHILVVLALSKQLISYPSPPPPPLRLLYILIYFLFSYIVLYCIEIISFFFC